MDAYLPFLTDIIKDSLKRGMFPNDLKLAEEMPLLKKLIHLIKLTPISLIFQKLLK